MKTLIIGALGQIGSELAETLYARYGIENVICADIRPPEKVHIAGEYVVLDVTDRAGLYAIIEKYEIKILYNLAAILSAKGEQTPEWAWNLNMSGLLNSLEAAKHFKGLQIFWPSSIAVFGPHSPRQHTPQYTIMDPNTVYGISKLAGERWCEYYAQKFGARERRVSPG